MVFKPTDYLQPSTAQEVCDLLSKHGKHARIIAGGTAIYELAKRGLADEVKQLVSLDHVPLKYMRKDTAGLHVGATTTLAEFMVAKAVTDDPALQILSEALREIRPMQVREVATVGGEVSTSLPLLDLPPALMAVETKVVIQSQGDTRTLALEDFLVDFFLNSLSYGEFVVEALIPPQPMRSGAAFLKFGRTAYDFNLVNVAARLTLDPKGVCSDARIILGGVGRVPLHSKDSEASLVGKQIGEESISQAANALGEFKAIPQIHGDADYKREIARVLVRDCLKRASERGLASS